MKTRSCERGGILVEFAVGAPIFFAFIFGIMQIALVVFDISSLNFTVNAGSRWGILGETSGALTRKESIENKIIQIGGEYGLNLTPQMIFVCPTSIPWCSDSTETTFNGGAQNSYAQYSIRMPTKMLFGALDFNLDSTVLARNEIFN